MSRIPSLAVCMVVAAIGQLASVQPPDPRLLRTATVQWVSDGPPLVYDIRYAGGDSTTMPTALRYLVKDLALSDGWYLTGEDKSKTVASQSKRLSLAYTREKSKIAAVRITKVEVKEGANAVGCTVSFTRKPAAEDVKRAEGVLETFTRKYEKLAKGTPLTVESAATAKTAIWSFEVRFKLPPNESD